jgi:hypothetical protein
MGQHNTLWMSRCTGAVYKEREVFIGINLCLAVSRCTSEILDAGEMLELHRLVSLVTHQDDVAFINAHLLTGFDGSLQEYLLCHQCLGTRVF